METNGRPIDIEELMREIARYLAVVEAFRAEGCDVGGLGHRQRRQDGR
jgi:hypothetical protein